MKLVAAKCPSCGANIKVDRSLKFTKCEYCDTEIMVEEAVENLLKVELKDSPTLENYLKLGERYFENQEFDEAYKAYSEAIKIDPDNPLVVLRRGLCKTLISEYNNLDINSSIQGMKNSLELMKKMKMSKKDVDESIEEVGSVLYSTARYIVDVYNRNNLNKVQTKGYIERLEECINGFIYLDEIVDGNKAIEENIANSILNIIDVILGNYNNSKYSLSSSYVNELKELKKKYVSKGGNVSKQTVKISNNEKVVDVNSKTKIIWDILCYIMIFFLFIMFLGAIFNKEGFLVIFLWLITILSFVPQFKRFLLKKYGSIMGKIVICARIVLVVLALIVLGSSPSVFENTYTGSDGNKIILESGKYTMINGSNKVLGTYHWESRDNDYYIYVQTDDNSNYEYRYRENDEGGSLCLLKNKQCDVIYLPTN